MKKNLVAIEHFLLKIKSLIIYHLIKILYQLKENTHTSYMYIFWAWALLK